MEGIPRSQERKETQYLEIQAQIEGSKDRLESERAMSIDMQLSSQEQEALRGVHIERELDQFDAFGGDPSILKDQLQEYFQQMGDNDKGDLQTIATIVSRLSEGMREGFGEEAVWTMVRVTLPNNEFELPRWHIDGKYFRSSKKQYKLVATLKGAQTRFGDAIDPETIARLEREESQNEDTHEYGSEAFEREDLRIRKELVKAVATKEIGGEGRAVIYLVGEEDAVLHSEPDITEPRIFVSILPGSEAQIAEWRNNLGK